MKRTDLLIDLKQLMKSTAEEIVRNLNELGDKVAIVIDGQDYSYAFIRNRVSALSKVILEQSEVGERVGLQLQNNINCYVGLLSLLITVGRARH